MSCNGRFGAKMLFCTVLHSAQRAARSAQLVRAAQRLACEGERPSEARVLAAHPKGLMAVLRLPLRVDRSIYIYIFLKGVLLKYEVLRGVWGVERQTNNFHPPTNRH